MRTIIGSAGSTLIHLALVAVALAAPPCGAAMRGQAPRGGSAQPPCTTIRVVAPATITLGNSALVKLPMAANRVLVGGLPQGVAGKPVPAQDAAAAKAPPAMPAASRQDAAANAGVADSDVVLLSPDELYLLGRKPGTMNVVVQGRDGSCMVLDVIVTVDPSALAQTLQRLLPEEKNIKVSAAQDSFILDGDVRDASMVDRIMSIAQAYVPEKKIVNMLHVRAPQQVMIDVKVAEVNKTLLDSLGAEIRAKGSIGGWNANLFSAGGSILDSAAAAVLSSQIGVFTAMQGANRLIAVAGENDNGITQVLAEPNIMAISGQQASFLSGGKLFIPVAQTGVGTGLPTITLQEEDFGIGLKFTPIVLDNGNINLKVTSEVSELVQTGSPFTTVGGVTSILPTFTTRSADTTVQLGDGQSFAVAGLIKNNSTESVQRVPGLGELPILGALFRSSNFQKDKTELVFVITPHLVKPLPPHYRLPTDNFVPPSYTDFFLMGKMEGAHVPAPAASAGASAGVPARGGFETK